MFILNYTNSRPLYLILIALIISVGSVSAIKAENQSLDALHQQVYQHVKQNIDQKLHNAEVNVRELPSSLNLPRCESELELSQRNPDQLHGRLTINVSCPSPSWRVFITVDINGQLPAVVASKGILRQAVINAEDVEVQLMPLNQVRRGAIENVDDVIGMRARRAIRANTVLTLQMLDIPYWVLERQEVTIITRVSGLEIKTTGTALESGMQQDQVSVRNNNSNIVVKGIVIAPNTVLVP